MSKVSESSSSACSPGVCPSTKPNRWPRFWDESSLKRRQRPGHSIVCKTGARNSTARIETGRDRSLLSADYQSHFFPKEALRPVGGSTLVLDLPALFAGRAEFNPLRLDVEFFLRDCPNPFQGCGSCGSYAFELHLDFAYDDQTLGPGRPDPLPPRRPYLAVRSGATGRAAR